MILELLFKLIAGFLNFIPFNLPSLPGKFQTVLDMLFDGITSSLGLLNIFIDLPFWISCAVMMTVIYNIKHIWNLIVYCLNLIPAINIPQWK